MVDFIPATSEHVVELAPTLRPEEREELLAQGLGAPLDALKISLIGSDLAWVATFDGRVVAMFGLKKDSDRSAQLWFLTGSEFPKRARHFLKPARSIVLRLAQAFGRVWVNIDSRYEGALLFARWLGFVVDHNPCITGPTGVPFYFAALGGA